MADGPKKEKRRKSVMDRMENVTDSTKFIFEYLAKPGVIIAITSLTAILAIVSFTTAYYTYVEFKAGICGYDRFVATVQLNPIVGMTWVDRGMACPTGYEEPNAHYDWQKQSGLTWSCKGKVKPERSFTAPSWPGIDKMCHCGDTKKLSFDVRKCKSDPKLPANDETCYDLLAAKTTRPNEAGKCPPGCESSAEASSMLLSAWPTNETRTDFGAYNSNAYMGAKLCIKRGGKNALDRTKYAECVSGGKTLCGKGAYVDGVVCADTEAECPIVRMSKEFIGVNSDSNIVDGVKQAKGIYKGNGLHADVNAAGQGAGTFKLLRNYEPFTEAAMDAEPKGWAAKKIKADKTYLDDFFVSDEGIQSAFFPILQIKSTLGPACMMGKMGLANRLYPYASYLKPDKDMGDEDAVTKKPKAIVRDTSCLMIDRRFYAIDTRTERDVLTANAPSATTFLLPAKNATTAGYSLNATAGNDIFTCGETGSVLHKKIDTAAWPTDPPEDYALQGTFLRDTMGCVETPFPYEANPDLYLDQRSNTNMTGMDMYQLGQLNEPIWKSDTIETCGSNRVAKLTTLRDPLALLIKMQYAIFAFHTFFGVFILGFLIPVIIISWAAPLTVAHKPKYRKRMCWCGDKMTKLFCKRYRDHDLKMLKEFYPDCGDVVHNPIDLDVPFIEMYLIKAANKTRDMLTEKQEQAYKDQAETYMKTYDYDKSGNIDSNEWLAQQQKDRMTFFQQVVGFLAKFFKFMPTFVAFSIVASNNGFVSQVAAAKCSDPATNVILLQMNDAFQLVYKGNRTTLIIDGIQMLVSLFQFTTKFLAYRKRKQAERKAKKEAKALEKLENGTGGEKVAGTVGAAEVAPAPEAEAAPVKVVSAVTGGTEGEKAEPAAEAATADVTVDVPLAVPQPAEATKTEETKAGPEEESG